MPSDPLPPFRKQPDWLNADEGRQEAALEKVEPSLLVPQDESELCNVDIRREARVLWKEHRKLEMVTMGIAAPTSAFIVALVVYLTIGGAMPWEAMVAGLAMAVISIPITLAVIFSYYRIVAAPRSLYEKTAAQLRAAQRQLSTAQADIWGRSHEVYFEHAVSMDKSGPNSAGDFEVYYDFTFTIRIFAKNLGANTTVERYKIVLDAAGCPHEGERITLDDYYIRHPGMKGGRIDDIEIHNDESLETSRNGWLRFVFRGVKGGELRPHDIQMELELDVIDIRETAHRLDMMPQSEWHHDEQWATKRIRHSSEL